MNWSSVSEKDSFFIPAYTPGEDFKVKEVCNSALINENKIQIRNKIFVLKIIISLFDGDNVSEFTENDEGILYDFWW